MPAPARTVFDFATPEAASGWRNVDDGVMGGVSESSLTTVSDDAVAFEGHVSLDRGGGFASVRSPRQSWDLSAYDGLLVRARGDDKRYKLTVYTRPGGRISYRFPFTASSDWADYFAPFEALQPMRRGRPVPDAPRFDPAAIRMIGVLIGDKQAGPFRLTLRWIRAITTPDASPA